uniref:hypothetical protein n=1 Tax=Thaumasiovibrio occultus TaxID=1891184 RepID=UPI00131C855B|nr:hypothetical protein [Thaumasiovibrio occultus]
MSFEDVEKAIGYVAEVVIPDNDITFKHANISLSSADNTRDYAYFDAENLLEDLMNL